MSEIQNTLITIALRGVTVLPQMSVYLDMNRAMSVSAATQAQKSGQNIFLVAQKDKSIENPMEEQLEKYGVVARIKQIIKGPDDVVRVLVIGIDSGRLDSVEQYVPYLTSAVSQVEDNPDGDGIDEIHQEAMLRVLKDLLTEYCSIRQNASRELTGISERELDIRQVTAAAACNLPMDQKSRQKYLESYPDIMKRYDFLVEWLDHEIQVEKYRKEYQDKVKLSIDKQQKEYILREQMKVIRSELGESAESNAIKYEKQLEKLEASDEVKAQIKKEITKLKSLNYGGPEISVCQNYIETLLSMPWEKRTEEKIEIAEARKILDRDHYGLEKVKEQVLEFLAVRKLQKENSGSGCSKGQILCLVGPPGTGKTSIARSMAKALNREYVRISLGGVRDEAEIRGHRRTYVAAMPGRIAAGIKKAGVRNPLMLLDELDKISSDTLHGDVSSAMLEVLDSEQNFAFADHYLEIPFDLSEVLFVATANTLQTIPQPLLDRMEVIEVNSYTQNEKYEIARRFLLPKQTVQCALPDGLLHVDKAALDKVISSYTREAGVRNLERQLGVLCRKAALEYLETGKSSIRVTSKGVEKYLGKAKYHPDVLPKTGQVGIVRGLAWTSVGGVTLEIEVNTAPGKGGLLLTGKLGDVMKESAHTAIGYVKSIASQYGISEEFFEKNDIHIHIPEGATPKDGPSAGITMAAAVLSAAAGINVRPDVAMTGEITLRGRVLPIGGLKEKLLAAKSAGIRTVLIPAENKADLEEFTEEITKGLEIIPVEKMETVVMYAFEK